MNRLGTVDFLRGIAALMVVFVHYFPTRITYIDKIKTFGHYGVEIFFVISGFIIPYVMFKSNFTWKDSIPFLIKRIIRIAPAAWIVILLILFFQIITRLIKGKAFISLVTEPVNLSEFFHNLFFTVEFTGYKWYVSVFWTLAVEFQFYLLIVFLFPLILKNNFYLKFLALLLLSLSFWLAVYIPLPMCIFRVNSYFLFGILVFLVKEKQINKIQFLLLFLFFAVLASFQVKGIRLGVGIAASLFILLIYIDKPFFNFLGRVSYSLYLTHVVVIILSDAVISKFFPVLRLYPFSFFTTIFLYTTICLLCAYFYHKFIEKPFIYSSSKVNGYLEEHFFVKTIN
jgi:peptidoglycan/LPS O-acetylase OafA/YrhL